MKKLIREAANDTFVLSDVSSKKHYAVKSVHHAPLIALTGIIKEVDFNSWSQVCLNSDAWVGAAEKQTTLRDCIEDLSINHDVYEFDTVKEMLEWCIDQL